MMTLDIFATLWITVMTYFLLQGVIESSESSEYAIIAMILIGMGWIVIMLSIWI